MKKLKIVFSVAVAMTMSFTANAQRWGATPEDSMACVSNVSLYQEYYKQKDYLSCYDPWREILKYCPAQHKNVYLRGSNILKAKIKVATTDEEREGYIDELMNMYDLRIQYFGEEAKVKAIKAQDLNTLRPNSKKEVYELYADAINVNAESLDENYLTLFFNATVAYVNAGYAEPTLIVDNYDIVSELLENHRTQAGEDTARVNKINGYIAAIEAIFSPFASCDQLVTIYQKKFEADPDNLALLKKITNIMMKKGCTEDQLFFDATKKLHALEPSPATAMRMGLMCIQTKKYGQAIDYLSEAAKGLEEQKDRYRAYIYLGTAYSEQNSYSAARSAYNKAAEVDPTSGEPYIKIAMLYAKGSRTIEDGMGGRSAYWAAVDKLRRAKSVDSSADIAEQADRYIGIYSGYYPKKNDAFMLDLIDGNSYFVGGWISESTTVRTR